VSFEQERCVVFLDPDNGLEPQNAGLQHVLETEARSIWEAVKPHDFFVFYQHQTNYAGQPWIEPKRLQLAGALGVPQQSLKIASGPAIARDVVLYYIQRAEQTAAAGRRP
jgi:hypothetical protein